MNDLENEFNKIITEAQTNPDILGLVLIGSRGKGFENEFSDYDAVLIVKDESAEKLKQEYAFRKLDNIDLTVYSLSGFREYAPWESKESWDRYNYAHTKILIDKTSDLEEIIKEKGYIPKEKQKQFIEWWIDGYVNGVFRSVKCIRNNNKLGAHLEAVNSILDLLTLVFGINGRHRPFLGYVEKELLSYPLEELPWVVSDFTAKISKVLETGDLKTQQELLKDVETWCRKIGYGHMFDGWEGKDIWTMNLIL